ncbi:hypothetical protein ncot_17520 [Nocardioides sp. JQ2195]|uniref:hypothetical protein n=1 Tax=Nocardioides sp. JQ2195 TaxID=2592334 RepID=UPI00143EA08A|nr:hypothetical protein [Nocardioides sp. JQ2195]QIX28188.1 hypothetical protein ncot_17520 [Nocardioides sp. JQ2195]
MSRRLRRGLEASARGRGISDDGASIPAADGASLALGVIDEFTRIGTSVGELTAEEKELLRLDSLLRQRRKARDGIEAASGRTLLRQALRGRRGARP